MEVFARGTTGGLYERYTTNGGTSWSPWSRIGGVGQFLTNTAPSACSWVSGTTIHTEVFITGTNNRCYVITQTGTFASSWTGWTNLGGYLTSAPAATALSDGSQIGLFVAGVNSSIYYDLYKSSSWTGWVGVGGQLLAGTSPAAYNLGLGQIGWFVTGTNNNLYWNFVGGGTGYANLGGVLTSSPSATARIDSNNKIDVFARGSTGDFAALYQKEYNNLLWGAWTAIGGV